MFRTWTAIAVALAALGGCAVYERNAGVEIQEPELHEQRIVRVESQEGFEEAVKHAMPGDRIVLANGEWADFDAVFDAQGTEESPIHLVAETPGKVIFTGQSSLRLAGNYLVASGFVFRDGYTPRSEVISFRRDSESLANNSRVTNMVIDGFSNPDRTQRDLWVGMYGRNNVFDFNHLAGKTNAGPTLAVRLNTEESQNNGHRITNNYFGPRPVLGSNGGETIRIGTSHYSLTHSGTIVENNYFDRCSGEVEIISNKSGGNVYRGNTFYASRGTLTLRHGNGTLIEGNLFDGAGEPYTGGVRVINADQTIRNNYFVDLAGTRFSGALVVMNGVPNSPINRYHQVDGAVIRNNTFERVSAIELGEGSDAERSAVPVNSYFRENIVVGDDGTDPFNLHDDMSGIAFEGNLSGTAVPAAISDGFRLVANFARMDSQGRIGATDGAGASGSFGIAKAETGVSWYAKADYRSPFEGGRSTTVEPGTDNLHVALRDAKAGDRFVLEPGKYFETRISRLSVPVTIEAAEPGSVSISFERPRLFELTDNGGLELVGLIFSGRAAPDGSGNSLIATSSGDGSNNHLLHIRQSRFEDFDVNKGFSVVSASKGAFFDRIDVAGSHFADITGPVFKLDTETDDFGIYNAEYLTITNSSFERISASVASVYRGGTDESTFGPHVSVTGSRFNAVGSGSAPLMQLHGAQLVTVTGNTVTESQPVHVTITTGKPVIDSSGNEVDGQPAASFSNIFDLRVKK